MRIGRLHFRLAERRRGAVLARFDAQACYSRLAELATQLDGQPWMVVSGLVEPLTRGRFSRAHGDIDIAVPLESVSAVAAAAGRCGLILTTRVLRTHISRRFDLEAHLHIEPRFLARRHVHLRLWRLSAGGELDESGFPPYVDVFPYVLEGRHMHILDSGRKVALQQPLTITAALPDGGTVPVEDPGYLEALRRPPPRDGNR